MSHTQTLLDEFSSLERCFTLGELFDYADSEVSRSVLRSALLNDKRFVCLAEEVSEECFFICDSVLFRWFSSLSARLARAGLGRLSAKRLATCLSSLRRDRRWHSPPSKVLDFGHQFGFVARAVSPDWYVFPIASLMGHIAFDVIDVIVLLLNDLSESEKRCAELERPMEYWVGRGLCAFKERVRYVVERRAGVGLGRAMKLDEIAAELRVTRSRVAQIEEVFWNRISDSPRLRVPFIKGLLCEVMRGKGSLLVSTDRPHLLGFMARCSGIPHTRVPSAECLVLGASSGDVASIKRAYKWFEVLGLQTVLGRVDQRNRICLSYFDLRSLCRAILDAHQKRLSMQQRAHIALRSIGRPGHYSEVTEEHNRLFPRNQCSDSSIRSALAQEKHGIVWVGAKGMYALSEWGYERPSKTLLDSVTEIVKRLHRRTRQAVPFGVIVAEMGKYRKFANPRSVEKSIHCNPALRRVSGDSYIPEDSSSIAQDDLRAKEIDDVLDEFRQDKLGRSREK